MLKLIIVAFLILTGCGSVPEKNAESVAAQYSSSSADRFAMQSLGSKKLGETVEVKGAIYSIVESYRAASGRDCKKLQDRSLFTVRVACQATTKNWYLRKSLANRTTLDQEEIIQVTPATVKSTSPPRLPPKKDVMKEDSTSFILLPGENLWRFSKRVTGNANNWQSIAGHNNIANVAALKAGQQLLLPSGMTASSNGN